MTPAELHALVDPLRSIARGAGERILEIYDVGFQVRQKDDLTPLTEADLAAHRHIEQGLRQLLPEVPVLSEESPPVASATRRDWEWLWLVDPLDGTREFIARSGQFSVNIALIRRHAPILGLIYIPTRQLCYFATLHGGAFKQERHTPPRAIRTRIPAEDPIRVAGGSHRTGRPLRTYLDYLGHHHYLSLGSSLKSCLVAEGTVDLYPRFGPTSEWDTAAAQIIVEEAGGGLTDMFMRPLRYNARPTLINPDFFAFGDPGRDWSQYLPRRKPRW